MNDCIRFDAPGADLGFSRGRGTDFIKFQKVCRPFFWVEQIDFPSTPRTLLKPYFDQILNRRKVLNKNRSQKTFDQKIAFFFGAHSFSKLVHIGAKGTFRKILELVVQK